MIKTVGDLYSRVPDPDTVGQSEYRAVFDLLVDVIESVRDGFDLTEHLIAVLDEFADAVTVIREEIKMSVHSNDPASGSDSGPCGNFAPDSLAPDAEDRDVCTTCFHRAEFHSHLTAPKVGRIVRASSIEPGGQSALVLITEVHQDSRSVAVTLLSPDLELGGSRDVVIAPEDSGLPYSLLAESDIFDYLPVTQLDRELGEVEESILRTLAALRSDALRDTTAAGPPIVTESDPRWNFKLHELERLRQIVTPQDPIVAYVDGKPIGTFDDSNAAWLWLDAHGYNANAAGYHQEQPDRFVNDYRTPEGDDQDA